MWMASEDCALGRLARTSEYWWTAYVHSELLTFKLCPLIKGVLRYAIWRILIFDNCISLTNMRTNAENDDDDDQPSPFGLRLDSWTLSSVWCG